jgi:DNA gyrase subunit A
LLTTAKGQAIRFKVTDIRVFAGRNSVGVRGINLASGDKVISMTILNPTKAEAWERTAFLKQRRALLVAEEGGEADAIADDTDEEGSDQTLSDERFAEMQASEQLILTLSERGYGKRSSSHEYRVSGRGGKGIAAMAVNERNGDLISSFPVDESDEVMLVTDGGQLIRCPIKDIRVAGRSTQGVTVFKTSKDEKVVSVERITETDDDENDEGTEATQNVEEGAEKSNEAIQASGEVETPTSTPDVTDAGSDESDK